MMQSWKEMVKEKQCCGFIGSKGLRTVTASSDYTKVNEKSLFGAIPKIAINEWVVLRIAELKEEEEKVWKEMREMNIDSDEDFGKYIAKEKRIMFLSGQKKVLRELKGE